jgi:hypothetical protein
MRTVLIQFNFHTTLIILSAHLSRASKRYPHQNPLYLSALPSELYVQLIITFNMCKSRTSTSCNVLNCPHGLISCILGINILLSTLLSNTCYELTCCTVKERDHNSYPYKTTNKIIVFLRQLVVFLRFNRRILE